MGDKDVVAGLNRARRVAHRWRVDAVNIAMPDKDDSFVEGRPQFDPRAEALIAEAGVPSERFRRTARFPAAFLLQRLRKIPVIQGDHRFNIMRQQLINQIAVELNPSLVNLAAASGQQTRP